MVGLNKSHLPQNLNWIATDQIDGFGEFIRAVSSGIILNKVSLRSNVFAVVRVHDLRE